MSNDTIVAQATAPGRGSVGIIRVSGPDVNKVAQLMLGKLPKPRYAEFLSFRDEDKHIIDQGLVLYFPNPHSFTGEDVLELQCHGGAVVLDIILKQILKIPNLRIAKPGEFSERAFLNDKIDLAQAEAIADLIDASSEQAAKSAITSLQGQFSETINQLVNELTELRIFVEAAIDFPEEEIDFLSDGKIKNKLSAVIDEVEHVRAEAKQGVLLKEGLKVVIAGKPNAGKSSLLNALSGLERAIVTDIAGTTRDVLREHIQIDGIPLHIIDTAGLRSATDEVERIGIERAWNEIEQADHVLFMIDSTIDKELNPTKLWPEFTERLPKHIPLTIVRNKVDIAGEQTINENNIDYDVIQLSAKTGEGIAHLKEHLKSVMGINTSTEGHFLARRRHLEALEQAAAHLHQGMIQLVDFKAGELLAEELRIAQQSLSEITGQFTSDDLLGKIFGSFCIGK